MDLTMPNLTGIDLAAELLRGRPDVPVILATGFGSSVNAAKARAVGIRELLMKPLTAQSLTQSVQRVLHQNKEN